MNQKIILIGAIAMIVVVAALLTYKVVYVTKNNQKIKLGIGPLYLEA